MNRTRRAAQLGAAFVILTGCFVGWLLPARAIAQNARWAIWVMKVDGSQPRMLAQVEGCTRHNSPRWSHDGKRVAFEANSGSWRAGAVYVVNADGSGLKRIGEHAHPDWSPDDKQIAFESYPPAGPTQVFVQNIDGEGRTQIAAGTSPRWSPDGSQLAVSENNNVHVVDLVGGEVRALFGVPASQIYGFSWFPDGKRLAVTLRPESRKHRQLLFVSAEGDSQPVRQRMENEASGFLSFSPDGKKLAFGLHYKIHIVDVVGTGDSVAIPGQSGANMDPDWSPDGEWIVFASSRDIPKR